MTDRYNTSLDKLCRAHHEVRTKQGFTVVPWDKLQERNRDEYRAAMREALMVLIVNTC